MKRSHVPRTPGIRKIKLVEVVIQGDEIVEIDLCSGMSSRNFHEAAAGAQHNWLHSSLHRWLRNWLHCRWRDQRLACQPRGKNDKNRCGSLKWWTAHLTSTGGYITGFFGWLRSSPERTTTTPRRTSTNCASSDALRSCSTAVVEIFRFLARRGVLTARPLLLWSSWLLWHRAVSSLYQDIQRIKCRKIGIEPPFCSKKYYRINTLSSPQ